MPYGRLLDLIHCYQISQGAEEKMVVDDINDMIPSGVR